ncbi:MAG: tetratricopeptide repeat protein [Sphingomonadaceae bacterium]
MILLYLAAEASLAGPAPSADEARFASCVALTEKDAVQALEAAGSWQVQGGGVLARQCAGLAYASLKRWLPAATAFQQAAEDAERHGDARAARLWVQAGNAALAGGDMVKAGQYLDAALAGGALTGAQAGEAHLDRARAHAATGDTVTARADLDMALKLVPADPLAWLLSATLARRTGDLARAQADIGEAMKRAPDDAAVALEAGNIAILSGAEAAARTAWAAAVNASPDSPAGVAAADALKRLGAPK